ncbi:Ferrous iron transport protein B, partial [Bathymodiolus heckerae thiotrophic gill symbiont]|uniref:FeoB small GTPase domain-containing protein n=1 Tax=Bathymodiolus heckerae thiotrophic gill symbiont TaxID=1052212 RepID=UPI0010B4EA64
MSFDKVALIGNPNAGKTTLFNLLTGAKQRTGNWPGVTVDRKEGDFNNQGKIYQIVDLPGVYSIDDKNP